MPNPHTEHEGNPNVAKLRSDNAAEACSVICKRYFRYRRLEHAPDGELLRNTRISSRHGLLPDRTGRPEQNRNNAGGSQDSTPNDRPFLNQQMKEPLKQVHLLRHRPPKSLNL